MRLANQFTVDAPASDVWDVLVDVERVAPCLPGARVIEKLGADRYRAGMTVKLGPMTMEYEGELELLERDPAARRARLTGSAREARGQGTANAQVAFALTPQGQGTRAEIEMDVQLSGRAAALGQGVLQPVAEKLVTEFASNLAQLCAPRSGAEPEAKRSAPFDLGPLLRAAVVRLIDAPGIVVAAVLALIFLVWECVR